jgi:hypothetical protein
MQAMSLLDARKNNLSQVLMTACQTYFQAHEVRKESGDTLAAGGAKHESQKASKNQALFHGLAKFYRALAVELRKIATTVKTAGEWPVDGKAWRTFLEKICKQIDKQVLEYEKKCEKQELHNKTAKGSGGK